MKEKLQGRLFYLLTGIPVILIPVLYLLLSMLTTQEDPWGLLKERKILRNLILNKICFIKEKLLWNVNSRATLSTV